MSDFFQNGVITTLQKVGGRPLEDLEKELLKLSKRRNMVLLLPALYSEFETPAMARIIEELQSVKYLHKIILGLDRATEEEFHDAKARMSVLPYEVDVIWNDGPKIQALYQELDKAGFPGLNTPGKGRNVWTMIGYGLIDQDNYMTATFSIMTVRSWRGFYTRLSIRLSILNSTKATTQESPINCTAA